MLHAPQTLRALVRANEIWLVVVAAVIGAIAGVLVYLMTAAAQVAHVLLFEIDMDQHLSAQSVVDWHRALLVPPLGGLVLGGFSWLAMRYWPRRAVDPIEANALYGGRMSLNDSLIVALQTIISNGAGASIGLEAGYTQIGAGVASRIGRSFRVRRSDLRLLVGCGAAGAISAAFNAPLCGAFYGYELVIGTYTLASFAPVAASAMVAVSVLHLIGRSPFDLTLVIPPLDPSHYPSILLLGGVCAAIAIAVMYGVTLIEDLFRRSKLPALIRPALGGVIVGLLALITPAVLSSGHGAIGMVIETPFPVAWVGLLIVLKSIATATSIGSGFRGGLFFASLFLGALIGKFFAGVEQILIPHYAVLIVPAAVVGMSATAVAIIGAPLAMSFLALEATSSLPMTVAVIGAVVVSSLTVRRTFGYSFATWRFHLRGEAIRSAVDIGWMRNLTVGRMMRRQVRTVRTETPLAAFRRDFPLGSTQRVVAIDAEDRYAGIVFVDEAHAEGQNAEHVGDILHQTNDMLLPQMTIKEAISAFEAAESDALVVVDGTDTKQVIGLLTEAYALRRYSEELDRSRRELSGE
ncbi:MAG TPA: chloride channel protein [Acetobacteraceae bacterium]|nr:chloride channel protein [Acetobacteraceae bacterium]